MLVVRAHCCCHRGEQAGQEELEPRRCPSNEDELARELLHVANLERFSRGVIVAQKAQNSRDECVRYPYVHPARIHEDSQDLVEVVHQHLLQLVEGDGVLALVEL